MTRPAVYVEGAALEISFADGRRNLQELIFDTVRAAVDDSGQAMHEIDSVVLAAHDLVDGRSLSSMVTSPAAGAYLRDEIRYGDDGAGAPPRCRPRPAGHRRSRGPVQRAQPGPVPPVPVRAVPVPPAGPG